uniref:Uncharacterized protein n=1 Tax=Arundo donax TaxID=35708 RepID=A0A0A9AN07_ARUDO
MWVLWPSCSPRTPRSCFSSSASVSSREPAARRAGEGSRPRCGRYRRC